MKTIRLRNHWQRHLYVHVEKGPVLAGPAWTGMLSSQWDLIPVSSNLPSIRIQNHWKKDWVLHIESGSLEAGPMQTGAHSAMWIIGPVETNEPDTYRIQNLWKPDIVLTIEAGVLTAGAIKDGLNSALWALVDPSAPIVTQSTASELLTAAETPRPSTINLPPLVPLRSNEPTIQWERSLTSNNDGSEYGLEGTVALNAQGLLQVAMTSQPWSLVYGRGANLNTSNLSKGAHAQGGLEASPIVAVDDDTGLALIASKEGIKRKKVLYRVGVANSGTGVVGWPKPWAEVGKRASTLGMAMKNRYVIEARGTSAFLQASEIHLRAGHIGNRRIEWLPKTPKPIAGKYPCVATNTAGRTFLAFRTTGFNPFSTEVALVSLSTTTAGGVNIYDKPSIVEGVSADKFAISINDNRAIVLAYLAAVSGGVRYRIGRAVLNGVEWGIEQAIPTELYAPRLTGGNETPRDIDVSINNAGKVVFAITTYRNFDRLNRVRVAIGQLAGFVPKPEFTPTARPLTPAS